MRTEVHPGFGVGAKKASDVSLDIAPGDSSSVFRQKAIVAGKDGSSGAAGIGPFVDDLLEDAGVGTRLDSDKKQSQPEQIGKESSGK